MHTAEQEAAWLHTDKHRGRAYGKQLNKEAGVAHLGVGGAASWWEQSLGGEKAI